MNESVSSTTPPPSKEEQTMHVRPFDPKSATEDEPRAAHRLSVQIRKERYPQDGPTSFEQFVSNVSSTPPSFRISFWRAVIGEGNEMIGQLSIVTPQTEDNAHLAMVEFAVLPEWRRQGVGTRLFATATEDAKQAGKTLLLFDTRSTVPAGEAFARRIGATVGVEGHVNELVLAEVDRSLMRSWIEQAHDRAADFELGWWLNGYPEDRLDEAAGLLQMVNSQPMGDLEIEDFEFTPERAREMDLVNAQRGVTRWTCYAYERESRTIAGFTELFITASQPETLEQGLTAVFGEYRNRGIGRWLKAAMVEKVLNDLPDAKIVRTSNADVNEPMLNINREMGFRASASDTTWQISVERAQAYLEEHGMPATEG
jgi:mycothiol synthase